MKNPLRVKGLLLALLAGATVPGFAALVPTEWAHRQPFTVNAPGVVQLVLPPAAYDTAQPGLADLRVIDANGLELPYLLDRNEPDGRTTVGPVPLPPRPKSFEVPPAEGLTQLVMATGTKEKIEAVLLETTAPFFLKAAHVDISDDGTTWQSLGPSVPLFRQFGAEQLRLPLNYKVAAFVRVTLEDFRTRPVTFTGARMILVPPRATPPVLVPVVASILRREEFAGETVLTVALEGRNLPLAALALDVTDPLFMRRVTVAIREAQGTTSSERLIATGTLYRVALEGTEARSQLELPLPENFSPPTRELLVHIQNGDSPPLTLTGASARQHDNHLIFNAPAAGTYRLLTGNPQATGPRYDLAAFAGEMRQARATQLTPGPLEATPDYRPRDSLAAAPLPDVPLTGAPLATSDWKVHRALRLDQPGVQELELDPAGLARSRQGYEDLRLLHGGNQIPYVLERPALSRPLVLTAVAEPDTKRPSLSRWRVTLPHAGLPLSRLTLTSKTPLFSRSFRLYEKLETPEGRAYENVVAAGDWSRKPEPGVPETRVFPLNDRLHSDTLWIETDNGDNPAITLDALQAAYPVVRLIFKVGETAGYELAYGNASVGAPSYDLSLVAGRLLTSPRLVARFDSAIAASTGDAGSGLKRGVVFWSALSLVVVVLLVAVSRMLPKPPAAP